MLLAHRERTPVKEQRPAASRSPPRLVSARARFSDPLSFRVVCESDLRQTPFSKVRELCLEVLHLSSRSLPRTWLVAEGRRLPCPHRGRDRTPEVRGPSLVTLRVPHLPSSSCSRSWLTGEGRRLPCPHRGRDRTPEVRGPSQSSPTSRPVVAPGRG